MNSQTKYVRIKKTASTLKGKKVKYNGEFIYPNGRHVVSLIVMNGSNHDAHGGYPAEVNIEDVDFLFDESLRTIDDPYKIQTIIPAFAELQIKQINTDMLDALEKAEKWVAMYLNLPGHEAAATTMLNVIRPVIAKAKGFITP